MEPTKVGSLMKIFNAGGRDVFLYKHLGFRRADDSRANPTFEEQKLETDSCKKWRGGQVGHIYNKVDTDRWVLKEVNDSMANNSMQDTSENQNSSEGGSWAWR